MNTTATVAGNLTRDPALRYTPSGTAVVTVAVAITPRRRNAETGNWENGETTYLNASEFGPTAEHVAESLATGDRVVVTGRLVERSFTATQGQRAGQEIRRHEIVIDEIGVSLRYATARPVKAHRNGDLHVVEDDENA